jgi:ATP-dependent DNA helicase UvrD/PcrA
VHVDPWTEPLLDDLTDVQRLAVTSEAAPLCILASAGAGKTRVLTRRIAYRITSGRADAQHTLALTFTRKAAGEMQARLRQLGLRDQVTAGTFHAVASAQLHRWWADRRQRTPALLERKSRLLGPLASARPGLASVPVSELAGHVEWAQARLIRPDDFEEAVRLARRTLPPSVTPGDLAALYHRYEQEKTRRGLVDFDDLIAHCARAMEQDPAFAAAQRWRWRHLFIDEFQDLNPLQHRLVLAWVGSGTDLCVVGDPHQAIYGWNGADPELLADIPRRWPTTEIVRLDHNHRCSPQIVSVAAAVLGSAGSHLRSAGRPGPPPDVRGYPSEAAEAHGIALGLRRAHDEGRPWSALAVLTRTNAQLIPIQKSLAAAAIPYWSPAQRALLELPAVRKVLDELRAQPHRSLQSVAADVGAHAAGVDGDDEGRSALGVLADLALAYQRQEQGSTVGQWLAWLPAALGDGSDGPGPTEAVTLCSFHRAKGLEWAAVWVAGLEQGLVPIGRSTSDAALAEERRLLYVALTRAEVELHGSWAQQRTFGGRSVPRQPSVWVALLLPSEDGSEVDAVGSGSASTEMWRARLREQRHRLSETGPRSGRRRAGAARLPEGWSEPDPGMLAALRDWRQGAARASGVPPHVVLHDTTLAAVASLQPQSPEQLLAVPGLGPVKAGRYGPALLALVSGGTASGGTASPGELSSEGVAPLRSAVSLRE